MMGRLSAAIKKIIRSIDPNLRWSLAHQELKRCVSDENIDSTFGIQVEYSGTKTE